MRKLFTLFLFLFSLAVQAQDSAVVKWSVLSTEMVDSLHYKIKILGEIRPGWHVYANDSIDQINAPAVSVDDDSVQLGSLDILSAALSYADPVFDNQKKNIFKERIEIIQLIHLRTIQGQLKIKLNYFTGSKQEFIPEEKILDIVLRDDIQSKGPARIQIPSMDLKNPVLDCGSIPATKNKGLWGIFFLGVLAGLLALITPCVFPMIPLTVSFFIKKSTTRKDAIRNASMYGLFIFIIYILLSLPFHFLDNLNPELLNNISTNTYLNIIFFAVFIFFAFSFFGFYEIGLPASFSTGADKKAGTGNLLGIFFMALTLALVSFSCTGPILGSLLVGSLSTNGGAIQLTAGMAGFGLALALPFTLLAFFPKILQSFPKSGGWLNTVKIVFGFLELGLAFKFLSNADLADHWGILKREIFIAIWVLTSAAISLYLFGWIKFKSDSSVQKTSLIRKFFGILFGLVAIYLTPGLTPTKWANLKLISGFPPPLYYSVYPKKSDCLFDLNCSKDYEEGLAMAKQLKKPVLIDFTGYACVNCRRMEENVWSDSKINELMRNQFIVISLYVDDKKKLPSSAQFTYKTKDGQNREIKSYGDLWSTFESENFANNAQPLYVLLSPDEALLTHPIGYTPDKDAYLNWLKCGLKAYNSIK